MDCIKTYCYSHCPCSSSWWWWKQRLVQFHASTHAQVIHKWIKQTFNTCKFLTDDKFAEEAEEEEVKAVQGQNTESKRPFQTKPLPPPKPQRKHIYMYIYCKVTIACWFTLQANRSTSVSLITGPVPGTSTVDDWDLIDVMDPVRALAKQALADLCRKENQQGNIRQGKIIQMAVDVLKALPREDMQLTKSELQKTAADTGNL